MTRRARVWRICLTALVVGLALSQAVCSSASLRDREREREFQRERTVGRAATARLARDFGIIRDPQSIRYLNLLAAALAQVSARPELQYHVAILDVEDTNAFALPGGYLCITRGAIEAMESEAELAGVLAHEMAHVVLKHAGNFQSEGSWMELVSGLLGGAGFLSAAVANSAEALHRTLLENGRQKDLELDADRAGALYAATLGYDPQAAGRYLQRVSAQSSAAGLNRTHPRLADRLAAIAIFVEENKLHGAATRSPEFMELKRRLERR
ncbi:MAG: M48 family metallopeptidase [Leptospirales bacterium]|nr:M48 family metallopeptidase [Leptospirales bacterium]